MKLVCIILTTIACCVSSVSTAATDYAHKVNTLIGTKGAGLRSGYLYPGATYPHGMVQFTPTYFCKNGGFVINQNSGGGCDHMGNFPTFPLPGRLTSSPSYIRDARISVTDEQGHAGYYSAMVQKNVKAELTVTPRTGMAQYTFPQNEQYGTVIIGAGIAASNISEGAAVITGKNSCEGYADGGYFCGIRTPYKIYFAAEFDTPCEISGTWKYHQLHPGATFAEGQGSGIYFTFNTTKNKTVHYKIGISYVSVENAKENLKAENPNWNFCSIVGKAEKKWNDFLGKIEVKGGTDDRTTQFYTHLYRTFIHPSLSSDINGEYMGADYRVHKSPFPHYSQFSNWDTYRTQIQLLAIIEPEVTSDMVVSLQDFAQQSGGSFPRWVLANIETGIMQGDPTAILVSNAWAFGARNYDPKPLFQIMRKGAEQPGAKSQEIETRPGLKQYLEKGYYNASIQLEYTSADFAIAQFALHAAGDEFASWRYFATARSWKNLYNPKTKWLQSRNEDGTWKSLGEDWREATYANYFWMVPYNIGGLIKIIGGKKVAQERLDKYFRRLDAGYGDAWHASGNEPSFGVPWVYNWAGTPWKTQQVINRILNTQFSSRINGLPGNDDLGSMGAWYVWACLGLYPEIPGVAGFSLNTPIFPYAVIHLPNNDITIKGGSEKNIYTTGLKVNGHKVGGTWLSWDELKDGANIEFSTSSKPNKVWGTAVEPPSYE
ncbi:MAG: GH92 family glycosyl hydrolase [Prevotella sp.]|jgi:predicted alpha-1,2-mannosidase